MPYVGNDPNILVYIEAYDQSNTAFVLANTAINQANGAVLKTGNTMTGNLVMSGANIAFTTATDSGIYWGGTGLSFIRSPAANTIVFGTSGAEDMRIDASGNVLIGTTIENSGKLSLGATVRNRVFALYDEGTNWYGLGIAGSEFKILRPNGAILTFGGYDRATDISTELMRLDSVGNLGIGTSLPTAKLHVSGNVTATVIGVGEAPLVSTTAPLQVSGDIFVRGSGPRTISHNIYYDTNWKYSANGYGWGFREDGAGKVQMLRAANNTSGSGSSASVSLNDLFTFDLANNNVGLGTAFPTDKLTVNGSIRSGSINVAGIVGIIVQNGALSANTSRNPGFLNWTDKAFGMELHYGTGSQSPAWATALYGRVTDTTALRLGSYPANSTEQKDFVEYMTILNTGVVGIGTTSPTAKLHVAGNVTAQAIDVAGVNVAPTIVAAFGQANTARTHANAAFAAANAEVIGVAAFGQANTAYTQANGAFNQANTAANNLPQNSQSSNYTLVASDAGKHIFHPGTDTTARTITIPANSVTPFPIGTVITFVNQHAAGVMTININSDIIRLSGGSGTGNRTLAANGMATALKITGTEWIISGSGLT
jgi:hypothetical protein